MRRHLSGLRRPRRLALGLQQRIMVYVTIGLLAIFASVAFVGIQSIQQATALVYQERLTRAYTIASTLAGDFSHVDGDVREERTAFANPNPTQRAQTADELLNHLALTDPFRFFHIGGIWVLNSEGGVLARAGSPAPQEDTVRMLIGQTANIGDDGLQVLPTVDPGDPNAFGAIVSRLGSAADPNNVLVVAHAQGLNSTRDFVLSATSSAETFAHNAPGQTTEPAAGYHLEVVGPEGRVVLGIGSDERPGALSYHFPVIQQLADQRQAASLVHRPGPGDTFEAHVMAVVPLQDSPFYLVLEQPVDVALALPIQLERWLIALTVVGFLAALLMAWITTGRVVRPTSQLTAAALRMAQGDLDSPIQISAQDEVGRLARSLESMRQQLRAAYQQLEHANRVLEAQVRERTARLSELLDMLISAQEEERARLARELHDESAQTLGALTIALDRARDEMAAGAHPGSAEHLAEARAMAASLLEETRRLILDLRPMALDDLGLSPAIRWYAESHLEEHGIETFVEVEQATQRLPKHVEVPVFRIAQEAINNIIKHADARHARIRLVFREPSAKLVVSDDGRGFDPTRKPRARSVGLAGMQERVRLLNGRLHIRSTPGRGTTIVMHIPIAPEVS